MRRTHPGTRLPGGGRVTVAAQVDGRGEPRRGGGYDRPKGRLANFEVFSWFFMRISGLVLILLALYHLIWWNLVIGVEHLDSQVVIERWSNPFWRLFNVLLVTFALLHGLNGARYSIEDYIRRRGLQIAVKTIVYSVVLVTLVIGVYALLTFDPASFFAIR
ncbi:MAG: succinate dehydrogenase [Gemmatimonas sp.]|nr:succinate dehydrogenase [Gemmatimonas sp.]